MFNIVSAHYLSYRGCQRDGGDLVRCFCFMFLPITLMDGYRILLPYWDSVFLVLLVQVSDNVCFVVL